jgi:uncharacterized protein YbgA (DUF1722 family)
MDSRRTKLLNLSPKSIEEIYHILEEIHGKPVEILKTITAHPFLYIRQMISKGESKGALLHNLGSFETYLISVNREIRQVLHAYRSGKLTRTQTAKYITTLWKLRRECMKQEIRYNEKHSG